MRIELGYLEFMVTARKIAPNFIQALSMVSPLWICYFVRLCRQSAQMPFQKSIKTWDSVFLEQTTTTTQFPRSWNVYTKRVRGGDSFVCIQVILPRSTLFNFNSPSFKTKDKRGVLSDSNL
jgi:hypothetical protein